MLFVTPRRLAILALALVFPSWAEAGSSTWAETDQTAVRLISATDTAGGVLTFGLQFRLDPGWKVYWRSPGDAGFPPRIDWSESENLGAVDISWPAPKRFSVLGFDTLGYTDEVVFPLTAKPARAGRPVKLKAAVFYLTCKDICIPYEAKLALDLPAGPPRPSAFAHLINRYQVRVPGNGSAHGLVIERAEAAGRMLRVTARAVTPFVQPDLYVEGPDNLYFSRPVVSLAGKRAVLELPVSGDGALTGGIPLVLTLVDADRSAERSVTVAAAPWDASLPIILALAVLGGLILNLMPCVLPVLSIKLMGVVGHGGGDKRTVRLSFIASAAGIVFSFLVLAAALIGLKSAGATVGWGIQFQQPLFLIAMTMVVTLFACNLWGFFDIPLPRALAGIGGDAGGGYGGHFLTGAFATVLATPCSAPFLGTAVGFALARGPGVILAVFACLGVGLALPYLAVAGAPGIATRLPRPGPWMVVLRRVLGFALAATALWLLSVLATHAGLLGAAAVGTLAAAAAGALYMRHRKGGRILWALGLATLAFLVPFPESAAPRASATEDLWEPFDQAAIPGLVAAGKTVFVDVTADWCITCQINKSLVIYGDDVMARLSGDKVVSMQADWTLPSEVISNYLASFGRYGIPFDVVYGPGAGEGIVLPELLTRDAVTDALERAAGPAIQAAR